MPRKTTVVDANYIVDNYLSGASENALAKELGVSRNVIRKRLLDNGIEPRTQSQAESLKWSQMTALQRKLQIQSAHLAARGPQSFEHRCSIARSVQKSAKQSPLEVVVQKDLEPRLLRPDLIVPQKAIGPYNCDLGVRPVAVEIFGGHWHWYGKHLARTEKRIRYICNQSWALLMLVINARSPWTPNFADYAANFIEEARRNPSMLGGYWVVWRAGKFVTSGRGDDDKISIKPPFRGSRDLRTGRYKTVSR
jgi:hypothetical protein